MALAGALTAWLRDELIAATPQLVLAGDYKWPRRPAATPHPDWKDEIHVSVPGARRLQGPARPLGLTDAFRLFEREERSFSWWDYRMSAFRRNFGLRIDHLLLSSAAGREVQRLFVDKTPRKLERPSDHAPVVAEIAL